MAFNRGPEKTPFWKSQVRPPSRGASDFKSRRPAAPAGDTGARTDADAPRPRAKSFTPGTYSANPDGTRNTSPRPYGRPGAPRPGGFSRPYGNRPPGPGGPRPYSPGGPRPYNPDGPRPYSPRPSYGAPGDDARPSYRKPFSPRPDSDAPRPGAGPGMRRAFGPPRDQARTGPRKVVIPPPGRSATGETAPRVFKPRPDYQPRTDSPPQTDYKARQARTRPDANTPLPASPETEGFAEPKVRSKDPTPPRPDHIEADADSTPDALPTAYLKPGEADRVLGGHPWIYESSVLRLTRKPEDGDIVQVKDHRRRLLGVGFYNSKSKIRIRILAPDRTDLEEDFLEHRIRAALEHRRRFLPDASSFRLVNAEGDQLTGLIVDKYEDVLVLQTSSAGMDRRKAAIVRILERLLQPRAIVERNDMGARKFEGLPEASGVLSGSLTDAELAVLPLRLNGLQFEANLVSGHKTGLYLDQQINHALVAQLAKGARVLDAFSFLGGFALTAARAGATSVLGLDQSADAVAAARRLAEANGLASICTFEEANVFDWLRTRTGAGHEHAAPTETPAPTPEVEPFDLIVLDPPSFTRNRASVGDALRGYKEIHLRALKLLRPGGILATFCCSHHVDALLFQGIIQEAAFDARRPLRRIAVYTQSPDHPVLPAVPETEYLKGFAFEVLTP